jgi:hypothetical protein
MRNLINWFDGLAPNHFLWAVGVYTIIGAFVMSYIHVVQPF